METPLFLGFDLHAWITIVTVLGMFTVMLCTKIRSDLVFLAAIGILFVTGVLDAKEAFSGFSGTSVITVGVLFVIVAGLTHTGVLQWIVKHLLGQPNSYSKAAEELGYEPFPFLVALMISVSSSFATPIGSPTHMLVYGPGGYRFSDFMRIGLLMNFIILAANIFIVNIVYPLTPLL